MDLRTIKTQKALYKSLDSLLRKKSFDKITVQDICDNAQINRVTFYNHYADKYDLFDSYVDYVLENLIKTSVSPNTTSINTYLKTLIVNVTKLLYENKNILKSLTNVNNSFLVYLIHSKINKEVNSLVNVYFQNVKLRYNLKLITTFIIGGFSSIISDAISNNSVTYDELIKESERLVDDILYLILEK